MKKGFFITFEGSEGGGKSTQIRKAASYLRRKKRKVLILREPGGTRISEAVRKIILNRKFKEMSHQTELLLYLAARAQVVQEKVIPALKKGYVVISDRYEDSTIAYQGYGRKISIPMIEKVSQQLVRGKLKPNLTFFLDLDPRQGLKRGGRRDRMEYQSFVFHNRVYQGFKKMAMKEKRRFVVLDASESKQDVATKIQGVLEKRAI